MNRTTNLHRLRTEQFDICILGGGATGAGCALDAASRGLKTALIERNDFSSATSSSSTKLVHGGVRYLEQAFKKLDPRQLSMVRKGLYERQTVLRLAPHLAHPLALLTPCKNWFAGLYFTIGLKLYDLLAGSRRLAPSRWLSHREALDYFPAFSTKGFHSAVLYYDGQFDDARFNLGLAQTADGQGAAVANHCSAIRFETDDTGAVRAVLLRDELSGETFWLRARVFVNATGTLADSLRREANPNQANRMRASKGAHVVLPMQAVGNTRAALLIPETSDGRVLFAIPWRGHYLIGTTDTEADPTETPYLQPDEASFLLKHVSEYLTVPLSAEQITGGFAGLRPLLQADPNADSKSLVRDHEVEVDEQSGLVSIMGGKWTTYRLMAQDTIDVCCERLGIHKECHTDELTLLGGAGYTPDFVESLVKRHVHIPAQTIRHLAQTYGTQATVVLDLIEADPALGEELVAGHPFVKAEVCYAARHEMAQTLEDLLLRRIRLGLVDWRAALAAIPTATALLSTELGWSDAHAQAQQQAFKTQIQTYIEQAKHSHPEPLLK
ncbi:glycerol-3-phosphate dehydrogenase/oxidase [Rudanella lutea]|uniref:glycerol-3-phosphate dehydrogenase/oxidase n=1 Tax=Rudanella lutea TaxID=451374 RepID=UPI000379EBEC|nr:FAD-dependent oxidoreductase [Rudanella lutea]